MRAEVVALCARPMAGLLRRSSRPRRPKPVMFWCHPQPSDDLKGSPMSSTVRPAGTSTSTGGGKAERRKTAARQRAEVARRADHRKRWTRWIAVGAVVLAAAAVVWVATRDGGGGSRAANAAEAPLVGGDLHSVTVVGDGLYVGGHQAAAVSRDGGRQWQRISSLDGADPMGWAVTGTALLVGGHPGLYRSTDGGATFTKVGGTDPVADVHALGAAAGTVYLASPQAGLLISTDGGTSWQVRNAQAGRSFMGSILVDPEDQNRLIAPDMTVGLATSSDGGRTWKPLGGPSGAMAATWNPTDIRQLIAVGMGGAQRSADGGATWQPLTVPADTTAVSYDTTGAILYAGVLDGQRARIYRSGDGGTTWAATT